MKFQSILNIYLAHVNDINKTPSTNAAQRQLLLHINHQWLDAMKLYCVDFPIINTDPPQAYIDELPHWYDDDPMMHFVGTFTYRGITVPVYYDQLSEHYTTLVPQNVGCAPVWTECDEDPQCQHPELKISSVIDEYLDNIGGRHED